jgi:hypothetical protein
MFGLKAMVLEVGVLEKDHSDLLYQHHDYSGGYECVNGDSFPIS